MRLRITRTVAVAAAALLLVCTAAQGAPRRPAAAPAHAAPQHIFLIMMENHAFGQVIGNRRDAPFINRLAQHAGVETRYFGVTHPSLPNYLATISGSFQGIWDDCPAGANVTCPPEEFVPGSGDATDGNYLTPGQIASASARPHLFPGRTLVDQLEAHGRTWKAYMQNLPSVGSQVEYAPTVQTANGPVTVQLYAQKHDPFMYFSRINHPGSARLRHIVPFGRRFAADLASGHVPSFAFISPSQCHDMHGMSPDLAALVHMPTCGYPSSGLDHGAIRLGDAFLRQLVGAITSSSTWQHSRSSIVIAWDENDYSGFGGIASSPHGRHGIVLGGGRAPLIVLNSWGSGHGRTVAIPANHYNLLATIQHLWGLGCLAHTCGVPSSGLLTPLFR